MKHQAHRYFSDAFPALSLFVVLVVNGLAACGQELVVSFNATNTSVTAGTPTGLWLNILNPSSQTATWTFPEIISFRMISPTATVTNQLSLQSSGTSNETPISSGAFARREYLLTLPATAVGRVIMEFPELTAGSLALEIKPPRVATAAPGKKKSAFTRVFKDVEPLEADKPFDPGRFFAQQISAHEPMYFIAGTESPNAKFQLSFKYQLLNENGSLATNYPALKGFNVAYTQTSLWDLSAPSAPFFDTSYKPAFLYSLERVVGRESVDWFRLDLQAGAQHESNGKNGVDSRSQNTLYFRPTLIFGHDDKLQLTLQPRVWGYIGDLSDNPDIDEYRGYFDLRAVIGWRRGLQLSALGRMGHEGNHPSLQLDLTYPTMKILDSFSVYLQAQYFTGYGESLLRYNERTDSFRLGFALYR